MLATLTAGREGVVGVLRLVCVCVSECVCVCVCVCVCDIVGPYVCL